MSTVIMAACWPLRMHSTAKSVLISLADNANDQGVCWPSIPTICERTCLGRTAVISAIKWLEENGALIVERGGGVTHPNCYTLRPSNFKPETSATQTVHEANGSSSELEPSARRTGTVRHADPNHKEPSRTKEQEQKITNPDGLVVPGKPGTPPCPHGEIISLYHEILPSLTRVKEWTAERQTFLRKRWNESRERQNLTWWRGFFSYVAESDFLTGKTSGRDGRSFECDLEWLVRPKNFVKVIEGRYENRGAAA